MAQRSGADGWAGERQAQGGRWREQSRPSARQAVQTKLRPTRPLPTQLHSPDTKTQSRVTASLGYAQAEQVCVGHGVKDQHAARRGILQDSR